MLFRLAKFAGISHGRASASTSSNINDGGNSIIASSGMPSFYVPTCVLDVGSVAATPELSVDRLTPFPQTHVYTAFCIRSLF